MRELRVQVVVPVLPKLVAGTVALFAVLSVVVLTKPLPEEDVPRQGEAREATLYTGPGG